MAVRAITSLSLLALLSSVVFAAEPTTAPHDPAVDPLLQKLDADDYITRQSALDAIKLLPDTDLPQLEAAMQGGSLSLDAKTNLAAALEPMRTRAAGRERYAALSLWSEQAFTAAYDRVGHHDPRWDADLHEALSAWADHIARHFSFRPSEDWRLAKMARTIVDVEHCDDPLAQYLRLRFVHTDNDSAVAVWAAVKASQYPPATKLICGIRCLRSMKNGDRPSEAAQQCFADLLPLVAATAADKSVPTVVLIGEADDVVSFSLKLAGDRQAVWQQVDAELAKALPEESVVRLAVKGIMLVDYAWDARGNGYSNTVTDDGWKLFSDRLDQAQKICERSYALFPNDWHAANTMLKVELGQGQARPRMELWFKRAIAADPQCVDAYDSKMYYLAPKWHGSIEDQVAFGKECLATQQFETMIPLKIIDPYIKAGEADDSTPNWGSLISTPYLAKDEVWKDIAAAYDGFLTANPWAAEERRIYLDYAMESGRWKEAAALLPQVKQDAMPETPAFNESSVDEMAAEVAVRLNEKPGNDPAARTAQQDARDAADIKRILVDDGYTRFGPKDAKWDADANAAVAAAAKCWGVNDDGREGEVDVMLDASKRALDAGCPDPLVRAIHDMTVDRFVTPDKSTAAPTALDDIDGMLASPYSDTAKLTILAGILNESFYHLAADDYEKLAAAMLKLLPSVMQSNDLHNDNDVPSIAAQAGFALMRAGEKPVDVYDQVEAVMKQGGLPHDRLKFVRLQFCVAAARAIRENPKRSAAALKGAKQWLNEGYSIGMNLWQADPDNAELSQTLQYICCIGNLAGESLWFRETTHANPDNLIAADLHLATLPEWARMDFARQCMEVQTGKVAFAFVHQLDREARQPVDGKPPEKPDGQIIGSDENWPALSAVYEQYLAAHPHDSDTRSEYASYACLAGRWAIAGEQMKILRDHVRPKAFYTQERLDACKAYLAKANGGTP